VTLTCPICRAANDAGPACRRCRADLTLCFTVEAQRDHAIAAARAAASDGRIADALIHANAAAALRRGRDASQLLATVHLLAGDFVAALSHHAQAVATDAVPLSLRPRIMEPS
jgi:hypothetical protein